MYLKFTHVVTSHLSSWNQMSFTLTSRWCSCLRKPKLLRQWAEDSDSHMRGGGVSKWTQHFPHSVFSTSSPSPPVSVHLPAWISTSAKKFKKVVGKETYSETLESTPSLEKEKFPQDYFPEVGRVMTDITNVSWWMNTRLVYTQQRCSIAHFKKL